jgi:Fe-S-cluster containining protein
MEKSMEDLEFLMKKTGINCNQCNANCCKVMTYNSKNLNIVLDEQDEEILLKKMLETGMDLITYKSFDASNYAPDKEKYVVKKIKHRFEDSSEFVGLENDYELKLENGILKIPVMNFSEEKNEEKNNNYLSTSSCEALDKRTNLCKIHEESPLFCKLFPYYLEPVIRSGVYNAHYFSGYFSIKITPCNENIANKISVLEESDKTLIKTKIHNILKERESFLARLTAFYEFNYQMLYNFESSGRISL